MKITNISIENLGPYVGENLLHFDIEDPTRNVILIGGKNGAGKTTLFNSIKIGLYGDDNVVEWKYRKNVTTDLKPFTFVYSCITETAEGRITADTR